MSAHRSIHLNSTELTLGNDFYGATSHYHDTGLTAESKGTK